jgi:hypothetical protein
VSGNVVKRDLVGMATCGRAIIGQTTGIKPIPNLQIYKIRNSIQRQVYKSLEIFTLG